MTKNFSLIGKILLPAMMIILLLLAFSAIAENEVEDLTREAIARELALVQNHPNPFNAHTTIIYNLLRPAWVKVDVFDLAGRRVDTILDELQADGENFAIWKTDVDPSGTYIYRVTVDDVVIYKKMSLVK